jgi:hypothetical protein
MMLISFTENLTTDHQKLEVCVSVVGGGGAREARGSHMLSKCSITEPPPSLRSFFSFSQM